MRIRFNTLVLTILLLVTVMGSRLLAQNRPPNVVIIYADDLGIGDIGCYGETEIPTPNIDQLAKEGLRLNDAHSSASTCTPSRYSILTGSYAWRKKGTNILPGDANLIIEPGSTTLPSVMQKAGYRTAAIGKWHLGLGKEKINWNIPVSPGPNEIGFDYSFIIPATLDRVPCVYMENGKVVNLDPSDPISVDYHHRIGNWPTGASNPELLKYYKGDPQHSGTIINGVSRIGYMYGGKSALWVDQTMSDILADRAIQFMTDNKQQPFFLYFAAPEPHVPRLPNQAFIGKTALGVRGDVIVQFDHTVGRIMQALKDLGLDDNTLVILSSDNGPVLNDGYADQAVKLNGEHKPSGPYRGGKYSSYEGGTRMPFIVRWPGQIKADSESNAMISQVDLIASLAKLAGQPLAKGLVPDSEDMLDVMLGHSVKGRESLVEQGVESIGFRDKNWKMIVGKAGQPQALYNLAEDVAEKNNVAAKNPEVVKELLVRLKAIKSDSFIPPNVNDD